MSKNILTPPHLGGGCEKEAHCASELEGGKFVRDMRFCHGN